MSGALFTRVKNWNSGDTILASDINAEFDNILAYFMPQYMDDYSATVNQMRTQTDPGESGSESLATSLSGELERLRFAISEIKGTSYWYQTATTSLSQLNSALGTALLANRLSSGRTSANSSQPMFLVPDGTSAKVYLKGSSTNFVYSIAGTQYTVSTDVTASGLTTAAASNNTCLVNDGNLSGQAYSKLVGENGTSLTVDNMGSNISALVGSVAAFKTGSTEYFLARVESTTSLTKLMRGCFFNSADSRFARAALTDNDTITLMKLTWVFLKTDGTIAVTYTNPRYGAATPTSPSIGDYWFDTVNNIWKYYNSTQFVDATATLIGICLQDSSGTKAARSFDFFKQFSDLNTIDVIKDSTTEVRSKFLGAQVSVYGTTLNWSWDFIRWNTSTDFLSGDSLATNTMYYLYLTETGLPYISATAPLDMRADRKGYYHPGETYRCVAFGRTDATGSGTWQEIESFYSSDRNTLITTLTAAVANLLPTPYNIQFTERTFKLDGTAGTFTQVLPPAATLRGQELCYVRTDATAGTAVVLDGYGSETINGSLTVSLYTQNECLKIRSDGSNWVITSHYCDTAWADFASVAAGTLITATTTVPTYGTVTTNKAQWKRRGSNALIRWNYRQTATGNNGSGAYLFNVPSFLSMDTIIITANTDISGGGDFSDYGLGRIAAGYGTAGGEVGYLSTYSATQLKAQMIGIVTASSTNRQIWGSSADIAFGTTAAIDISLEAEIPVAGWIP